MSMIVARMQKMKAENLVGIGNHNQRKTKNHSNPDIDISLSKLNYDLVDRTQNYKTDIENFINENKSTTRAVRKDAVLVNEWIISSDKDIDDYNDLVKRYNNLYEENTSLKSQIGDLKEEIKLIYQSTKRFLKDRISDFKAFKEVFKELADNISNISREKGLDSSFKKEFDRENKKKQTRGIR
ncbi:hypothetical protein U959_02648 [Staphylococcus aureus 88088-1]|uniref:plasmid recombination protein n=1 Tax=Staphylococcus aureus TaxID=1280 RepID=UPI00044A84EF|nr:plasmid recombination protein [Staphylococcus aureus]EZW98462.1 hypothetical protein U959_02648 [Staphylococcus aureus 88088-1]